MNSDNGNKPLSGIEAAGVVESSSSQTGSGDVMKRAAAKQMIERYYYQLTDGCGDASCENDCCASCPTFRFQSIDRNQLAVQAIELFQKKARLCENKPQKCARYPVPETQEPTTETKLALPLSEPSTSGAAKRDGTSPVSSVEDENYLTEEKVLNIIHGCREAKDWSRLIRIIGSVFNNPESLLRSFLKQKSPIETDEQKLKGKAPIQESAGLGEGQSVGNALDSVAVDISSVRRTFAALMEIPDHPFQGALNMALLSLSKTVEMNLKYHRTFEKDPNYLSIFIIVMEIPLLHCPEFIESSFPQFCQSFKHISIKGQASLAQIWSTYGEARLREMLQALQQLITVRVIKNEGRWDQNYHVNDDEGIVGATRVMKIVYYASLFGGQQDKYTVPVEEKEASLGPDDLFGLLQHAVGEERKEPFQQREDPLSKELGISAIDCRGPLIPFEEFVNEPLNDNIDITTDYAYYRAESDMKFSFVLHNFILTTASKQTSMYFDNRIRMLNERRTSLLQTIVHGAPPMPYLRVRVRRDHIIEDALVALEMVAMENPADLKKQLFVEFEGEQGLDEGGVSKEFFQLIVEELFNPDIGMFTFNEETGQFWLNPTSFENDGQFTLIGIVLGLAIYNSCILDVHFPMVVYRKLMGRPGIFEDLAFVDPTLYSSLKQLLEYDRDDIHEVFMQYFRIGYRDVFGTTLTYDLKEGGKDIPVTQENKREFVDLYANFLMNDSIERQFRAFRRGFNIVTNESPLKLLFRPEEIELLVCGSKHLDFGALEEATGYDGGFTEDSPTIKNFWEVVHNFTEEQKRKLLQFTTGTDRVPVGGLSKLKLIVARNGPDSDRLPTSHTCFNVLLLPDYANKDKLQERLLKAINYAKGFGML